jgi:hypothetical protein
VGWNQLSDIYREAADDRRDEEARPPEACPHDGTPLEAGPRGELHCPFDGYQWPRDGKLI